MKKFLLGLVATVTFAAPLALVATPAEAANAPCMTRAEFRKIHKGMTVRQVKRIVGSAGRITLSSPPMVIRDHKTCTAFHVANVGYWSGKVQSKTYI
jgi:hypothetical protein